MNKDYLQQAVERQKHLNRQELLNMFCPRLRQLDSDDRMRVIVYGAQQLNVAHKFKDDAKGLMIWSLARQGYFDKLAKKIGISLPNE